MRRTPLLFFAAVLLWAVLAAPAPGAVVGGPVTGEIKAIALSGDAIVVARRERRAVVVERRVAGRAPAVLLRLPTRQDDDVVGLAASPEAVAVSVQREETEEPGRSRVLVGPATGPLREVTSCLSSFVAQPVAVAGARIAWGEGGCGESLESTRELSPAAVAVGAADPTVVPRRYAISDERVLFSIALRGEDGLLGTLRPSLFSEIVTEVRTFGPAGNETIKRDPTASLFPVGLLDDGTGVLVSADFDEDDEAQGEDLLGRPVCASKLLAIGPGAVGTRSLPLGGCLSSEDSLTANAVVAGDRVAALAVRTAAPPRDGRDLVDLVTTRANGADRRTIASGRYRIPAGLAAAPGRVAWWQPRCAGGNEIVVVDAAPSARGSRAIGACRAEPLGRRARSARDGRASIRLRCPRGCKGSVTDVTSCDPRRGTAFTFGPGTHRVRVRTLARTRRGKMLLRVNVENGPRRTRTYRLVR